MKIRKLEERLKVSDFKLKSLLEITQEINSNAPTTQLLAKYREIVENQLGIPVLVLFICTDNKWKCVLQYGIEKDFSKTNVTSDFGEIMDMTSVQSSEEPKYEGIDLIVPVMNENKAMAYLLISDSDDEYMLVSPIIKNLRVIQTLTNFITVAIENKALALKSLEQERTRVELQMAAEMQALMVGSGTKNYKHFEAATYYKPHLQVGGDFCDFMELNEDEAFICVADVSGKGVSAAFLMANVQAYLQALLKFTDWTLESLVTELNEKVMRTVNGDRFITLFIAHFHRPSRTLEYINAGHSPSVLLNGDTITILDKGTVGIGMLKELPFTNKASLKIEERAILLCYTDGVVEIENEAGEEYGYERIGQVLQRHSKGIAHADDMISHIVNDMDIHRGQNAYFDDTALLCCRFR